MKKFFKNLLFFCIPLLLLFIFASIFSRLIANKLGIYKINPSVTTLFLGHSQPECDLNDSLIATTKNLAQGGEAYIYTYQKVKKILETNSQIKTVVVSFSNNQTEDLMTKWSFGDENMENFYPKYNFMMDRNDISLFVKNNFSSFLSAQTKAIATNIKAIASRNKNKLDDRNWGGYLYLIRNKTDSLVKSHYADTLKKQKNNLISTVNIDYLSKIIAFCKQKNVKVVFIRLPMHKSLFAIENETEFLKIKTSKFKDIPFLDFHNFEATNKEFADLEHLNHTGAKRFSLFFNSLIQNGILTDKNAQTTINTAMQIENVTQKLIENKPL